jgi:pyruvate,orthophosphate dikinase
MFYGANSEKPLSKLRKMILCDTDEERKSALEDLEPYMKAAVKSTMRIMDGKPVVFRLLDPPLHEFVPKTEEKKQEIARELGKSPKTIDNALQRIRKKITDFLEM